MKRRVNLNISAKLILLLVPLLLGVLLLFGMKSDAIYRDAVTRGISEQLQLQVDSAAFQMSSTLSEINRQQFTIYGNLDMRKSLARAALEPSAFTAQERIDLYKDIINPLFEITNSPARFAVVLYPASERVFCDYRLVQPLSEFPEGLPLEEMKENGFAHTFYNVALTQTYFQLLVPTLCITRVMYHSDGTFLGVLNAHVVMDVLERSLQAILPEEDAYWYRCALPDGQVLFEAGERTEGMLVLSAPVTGPGALLEFGVASRLITEQTVQQKRLLMRFAVAVLLAAALLIALSSHLVMRRLQHVLTRFSRLRPGQSLTEEALSGGDEAARLDQTFTSLYRDYQALVAAQQTQKEHQRQLETSLMLSRINPHFLYNTLSAIRWKLPVEDWEVVDQMVSFYRGMLGKGRNVAPLQSEETLMEQYLSLQKFTYSRKIEYEAALGADTRLLIVPKFLLQPVFENAIQHSGEGETVHLRFTARREGDRLILTLENDGTPIDRQTMERLNAYNDLSPEELLSRAEDPGDRRGYGVFNIITRLRLLFGEGYGLWYEPTEVGTLARFVLPVREELSEEEQATRSVQ